LIAANGSSYIRVHFTGDFAIVEALILQNLLYTFNQLIGARQHHRSKED
jgi:hypothetical protein